MDVGALIDQLETEGVALADAALRRGLDAPVPGLEWNVRSVVTHVGGVHRWATTIVRGGTQDEVSEAFVRNGEGPPDAELLEWFSTGHADLVAALRAAPDDLEAFTFMPADSPRHFWARRQAHETAIHRADAEGQAPAYGAAFAADGIDEILHGFAQRRSQSFAREATVALRGSDGPSWQLRLGGERTIVEPATAAGWANTVITGTSSDLYLWLWNRPSGAQVRGDAEVAALWAQTVRVSWS